MVIPETADMLGRVLSAAAMLECGRRNGGMVCSFHLLPTPPLTGGQPVIAVRPAFMPLLAQYRVQVTVLAAGVVPLGVAQHIARPIRDAILYFVSGW
jgi:hypothetical protein